MSPTLPEPSPVHRAGVSFPRHDLSDPLPFPGPGAGPQKVPHTKSENEIGGHRGSDDGPLCCRLQRGPVSSHMSGDESKVRVDQLRICPKAPGRDRSRGRHVSHGSSGRSTSSGVLGS